MSHHVCCHRNRHGLMLTIRKKLAEQASAPPSSSSSSSLGRERGEGRGRGSGVKRRMSFRSQLLTEGTMNMYRVVLLSCSPICTSTLYIKMQPKFSSYCRTYTCIYMHVPVIHVHRIITHCTFPLLLYMYIQTGVEYRARFTHEPELVEAMLSLC